MSWEKRHFMFSISKQRHVTADLTGYCSGDCKIRVSRQRLRKLCGVFQQSGLARTSSYGNQVGLPRVIRKLS